jgi:N6-adenosine-specific RNA methylase IME4
VSSPRYRVILADPPWSYQNWTAAKHGAAVSVYKTMTLEDICALRVDQLAQDDAALFLWITGPKLTDGAHIDVMRAWRFRPVTVALTWAKTYRDGSPYCGLGFYTRSATEFCLLGIRGRMQKQSSSVRQLITAPRGAHSAKPDEQYERIETLFEGPYLEMFARRRRPGWAAMGNEAPGWALNFRPEEESNG